MGCVAGRLPPKHRIVGSGLFLSQAKKGSIQHKHQLGPSRSETDEVIRPEYALTQIPGGEAVSADVMETIENSLYLQLQPSGA